MRSARHVASVLLATALQLAVSASAHAQEAPVDLGAYGGPLRFEAPEGTVIEATDRGRYAGTIVTALGPEGMVLVNDLTMDAYLEGLAEMPASWPLEALKAQAVAARTYAWYSIDLGTFERRGLPYDICATVACQVFRGREIVEQASGDRWARAVAETSGEVLRHGDGPILARYFSTSGGHTRNNEHVFPSEGPRPYLLGVPDPEDAVSPLHHWRVVFTRARFDEMLSRGEQLSATVPVASVEIVPAGGGRTDQVRVARDDGHAVEVNASDFRQFVSAIAPDLWPGEYPSLRDDGESRLPDVLPSSRMSFTITDEEVVIDGRGWGHGVGMSQWGARGKAEQGLDHASILSAYYTGVAPERTDASPTRVRVGLDDDAGTVQLRADGPVRVLAGDQVITDRGLGTWTITEGPDRTLRLAAPPGYGAPLVVAPTTADATTPSTIQVVTLETVVNKAAELDLVVRGRDGGELLRRRVDVVDPGRRRASWELDGPDGTPLPPDTYTAELRAIDEDGTAAGSPVEITVRPFEPRGTAPRSLLAADATATSALPWLLAALLVGIALGALAGRRIAAIA